jgi:hypothetical protein
VADDAQHWQLSAHSPFATLAQRNVADGIAGAEMPLRDRVCIPYNRAAKKGRALQSVKFLQEAE